MRKKTLTYFVQEETSKKIGVGYTTSLEKRMAKIRRDNPLNIFFIGWLPYNGVYKFCQAFRHLLTSPNWFDFDESMKDFMKKHGYLTDVVPDEEYVQVQFERIRQEKNKGLFERMMNG